MDGISGCIKEIENIRVIREGDTVSLPMFRWFPDQYEVNAVEGNKGMRSSSDKAGPGISLKLPKDHRLIAVS
jgi:hypothetical protein